MPPDLASGVILKKGTAEVTMLMGLFWDWLWLLAVNAITKITIRLIDFNLAWFMTVELNEVKLDL
jgi:hypothetical protein